MIMKVCSVFDTVSGVFARPIFVVSSAAAVRMFMDELIRDAPDNVMFRHGNDFRLFLLGTFDDTTGLFVCKVPELLYAGLSGAV